VYIEITLKVKEIKQMSERAKDVTLARYIILVNAGIKVSESLRRLVERIEAERTAVKVASV
jgi:hypothetical protein